MSPIPIWLDSDPGHDDAVAILLACSLPEVKLLGLSTTHGNATADFTFTNGVRLLEFYAADQEVKVWRGADKPLIRHSRADPEIHGPDGLGGADELPGVADERVQARLERSKGLKAIHGMASAINETYQNGAGQKVTLIATGPLTNLALFFSVYPELIDGVEQIVFMGGGVGIGNRSPVAEFNILCDPEAAQIVLDVPIPKVMIPLNVTHTALLTSSRHAQLLDPASNWKEGSLPSATTPLRSVLSSALSFFVETYKSTFGFLDGPPLHDVLTIVYVVAPQLFQTTRYRVDVELGVSHAVGETVVDLYRYRSCDDSWGKTGLNCHVAAGADIPEIFEIILRAVALCDERRGKRSS
ncbi:Uridine nucleosidase 1 [Tulasnella sp. 424]|nr:Uridine nucleosidase 1 [Tulasnella sp. 424]KAG8981959.1 Uridine nucleosidase 1 [Tulasnella sp. 425]